MSKPLSPFNAELGQRLRALRESRGQSLGAVEKASGRRWLACLLGAYERGSRKISVERLVALADWYEVPLASLLPGAPPSLAAAAYCSITAAQAAIRQRMAEAHEAELAELRSENALLRSQIREAVA